MDGDEQIQIHHVIECKYSGDKPWVIFTANAHQIAPSACANQTISSRFGRSIAWTLAGDRAIPRLGLFGCPKRGGFGGRQAFSKGSDQFYNAMQSVVSKANSLANSYD
ncbi:MAG TPA: hypothetical protein V6C72_09810, partial [Chroococcales cyanobacterium]